MTNLQELLQTQAVSLKALPPLALYIHFPWCEKKCPYCDFNSHQIKKGGINQSGFDEKRYIQALIKDLETELPNIWGRQVHSIFIGGGTPSLLSPTGMDELLCAIRARMNLEPDAEITMEANPGSIEAEKFAAANFSASMDPGLASMVISASGSKFIRARIAQSNSSMPVGDNKLGVPPPIKIL